jgi:hypothetical protein
MWTRCSAQQVMTTALQVWLSRKPLGLYQHGGLLVCRGGIAVNLVLCASFSEFCRSSSKVPFYLQKQAKFTLFFSSKLKCKSFMYINRNKAHTFFTIRLHLLTFTPAKWQKRSSHAYTHSLSLSVWKHTYSSSTKALHLLMGLLYQRCQLSNQRGLIHTVDTATTDMVFVTEYGTCD